MDSDTTPRLPMTIGFIIIFGGLAILFTGYSGVSLFFCIILLLVIAYIWRSAISGSVHTFFSALFDAIFRTRRIG